MLSASATLRSATVRLYRPTSVHVCVSNYHAAPKPMMQKNDKIIQFKHVNILPETRMASIMSAVTNAGVILSPRKLGQFAETPNMPPQVLLDVIKVLNLIKSKDGLILTTALNTLTKTTITEDLATKTWNALQDSGVSMDSARLHLMITLYRHCNMTENVITLANRGFEERLLSSECVLPIANYLMENGKSEECFALVRNAHESGVEKTINTMYNLINNVARANVEAGTKLFFDMIGQGIKPDYSTVSMLVFHVFTLMAPAKRTEVLLKLRPVIESSGYDIRYLLWDIFAHYIDNRLVTGVKALFKDWFGILMQPLPDHSKVDFHLRKHANSKGDDWERACKGVIEAYEALHEHNFPPDSSLYMMILTVYDRLGSATKMVGVLSDMLTRNCSTVQAYSLALSSMARTNNIEMGRVMYQVAKSSNLFFTVSFYHSALKLAASASDLIWARSLFEDMKSHFKDIPANAYETMLQLLIKNNKIDESVQLMEQMLSANKAPSAQTLVQLFVGMHNRYNEDKYNHFLREAKRLDIPFTAEQVKVLRKFQPVSPPAPSTPSPSPSTTADTPSTSTLKSSSSPSSASDPKSVSESSRKVAWPSKKTAPIVEKEIQHSQPLFNHATNNNNNTANNNNANQQQTTPTYSNNNISYSNYDTLQKDNTYDEYGQVYGYDQTQSQYADNNYYDGEYEQEYDNTDYSQNENLPSSFSPHIQQQQHHQQQHHQQQQQYEAYMHAYSNPPSQAYQQQQPAVDSYYPPYPAYSYPPSYTPTSYPQQYQQAQYQYTPQQQHEQQYSPPPSSFYYPPSNPPPQVYNNSAYQQHISNVSFSGYNHPPPVPPSHV